ncbi:MAG TPA: hypothetical protein VII64_04745 [Thermodesulfobacteriota bacterium]
MAIKKSPKKFNKSSRPFPRCTLEEAIQIPLKIKELNGGKPWSPADVANALGNSAKTNNFFYLTAASRDYGLTEGTRNSKEIGLAEHGKSFAYADSNDAERTSLQNAFFNVRIFKDVYDHFNGSTLPELKYLANTLESKFNLASAYHDDFHRIFQANCHYIQKYGDININESKQKKEQDENSDRILTLATPTQKTGLKAFIVLPFKEKTDKWPKGFFSEVLNNLITPAVVSAGFSVETAKREGSDIIQATIVNALINADLVIADLTDHNPNVLFELGIRMAFEQPIALIRASGTAPIFDVDNLLRVVDYNSNLWKSTLEHDIPALSAHIKGAWDNRKASKPYMKLLRGM